MLSAHTAVPVWKGLVATKEEWNATFRVASGAEPQHGSLAFAFRLACLDGPVPATDNCVTGDPDGSVCRLRKLGVQPILGTVRRGGNPSKSPDRAEGSGTWTFALHRATKFDPAAVVWALRPSQAAPSARVGGRHFVGLQVDWLCCASSERAQRMNSIWDLVSWAEALLSVAAEDPLSARDCEVIGDIKDIVGAVSASWRQSLAAFRFWAALGYARRCEAHLAPCSPHDATRYGGNPAVIAALVTRADASEANQFETAYCSDHVQCDDRHRKCVLDQLREGDFSCLALVFTDPLTGCLFPNNVILGTRLSAGRKEHSQRAIERATNRRDSRQLILEFGINVLPLHRAALHVFSRPKVATTEALLVAGCDPEMPEDAGRTAPDLSQFREMTEAKRLAMTEDGSRVAEQGSGSLVRSVDRGGALHLIWLPNVLEGVARYSLASDLVLATCRNNWASPLIRPRRDRMGDRERRRDAPHCRAEGAKRLQAARHAGGCLGTGGEPVRTLRHWQYGDGSCSMSSAARLGRTPRFRFLGKGKGKCRLDLRFLGPWRRLHPPFQLRFPLQAAQEGHPTDCKDAVKSSLKHCRDPRLKATDGLHGPSPDARRNWTDRSSRRIAGACAINPSLSRIVFHFAHSLSTPALIISYLASLHCELNLRRERFSQFLMNGRESLQTLVHTKRN